MADGEVLQHPSGRFGPLAPLDLWKEATASVHTGALPVALQLAVMSMVLVPLIFLRKLERPRRRLSVWFCDILRLGIATATAELILAIIFLNSSSLRKFSPATYDVSRHGHNQWLDAHPHTQDAKPIIPSNSHSQIVSPDSAIGVWPTVETGDPQNIVPEVPKGGAQGQDQLGPPSSNQPIAPNLIRRESLAEKLALITSQAGLSPLLSEGLLSLDLEEDPGEFSSNQGLSGSRELYSRQAAENNLQGTLQPVPFPNKFHKISALSLLMRVFEVFPGVIILSILYLLLLRFGFACVKYYKKKQSPKVIFVRDPDRGWVLRLVRRPNETAQEPRESTELGTESETLVDDMEAGSSDIPPARNQAQESNESISRNNLLAIKESENAADGYGFISGNYGSPTRARWLIQQTALLTICTLAVRLFIIGIGTRIPEQLDWLQQKLFGWVTNIHKRSVRIFLMNVLFPYIIYAFQFVFTDYMLKYHVQASKDMRQYITPVRSTDWDQRLGLAGESYEMDEFSIGINPESRTSRQSIIRMPSGEPNSRATLLAGYQSSDEVRSNSLDITRVSMTEDDDLSLRSDDDEDIYFSPADTTNNTNTHSTTPTTSPPGETILSLGPNLTNALDTIAETSRDLGNNLKSGVSKINKNNANNVMNVGIRYGVVTASLLNAAAANATASARPLIFGQHSMFSRNQDVPDQTGDQVEHSSPRNSIDGVDELNETSNEELPSYDASQRYQQALLQDRTKAEEQQALIADLKRNQ